MEITQTEAIVEARVRELVPELQIVSFGCLINPSLDSVDMVLHECLGGVKVLPIFEDEGDAVYGMPQLVKMKQCIGHPIHLQDVLLALQREMLKYATEVERSRFFSNPWVHEVIEHYNLSKQFHEQSETLYKKLQIKLGV